MWNPCTAIHLMHITIDLTIGSLCTAMSEVFRFSSNLHVLLYEIVDKFYLKLAQLQTSRHF